jgi:tetratricopeptide (TPR) repeat protein
MRLPSSYTRLALIGFGMMMGVAVACTPAPQPQDPISSLEKPETSADRVPVKMPGAQGNVDVSKLEGAIEKNDGPAAIAIAEDLLKQAPTNSKVLYYAGLAYEINKQPDEAMKRYRKTLEVDPRMANAAINLAALLSEAKKASEAVSVLETTIGIVKDDPLLREAYADTLTQAGQFEKADAQFKILFKPGEKIRLDTRLRYAELLIRMQRKPDAVTILKPALDEAKGHRNALLVLAKAFGEAGDYDDAIDAANQALKIKEEPSTYTRLALFKRSKKLNKEAKADLEKALTLNPDFEAAHFYLGEVLLDMKNKFAAKKHFQQVIKLAPNSPRAEKAKKYLEGK